MRTTLVQGPPVLEEDSHAQPSSLKGLEKGHVCSNRHEDLVH